MLGYLSGLIWGRFARSMCFFVKLANASVQPISEGLLLDPMPFFYPSQFPCSSAWGIELTDASKREITEQAPVRRFGGSQLIGIMDEDGVWNIIDHRGLFGRCVATGCTFIPKIIPTKSPLQKIICSARPRLRNHDDEGVSSDLPMILSISPFCQGFGGYVGGKMAHGILYSGYM